MDFKTNYSAKQMEAILKLIELARAGNQEANHDIEKLRQIDKYGIDEMEKMLDWINIQRIVKSVESGNEDENAIKELVETSDRFNFENEENLRIGKIIANIFCSPKTKNNIKQFIWSKKNKIIYHKKAQGKYVKVEPEYGWDCIKERDYIIKDGYTYFEETFPEINRTLEDVIMEDFDKIKDIVNRKE
jgi:hypothetical protein